MKEKYVAPQRDLDAFNCPYCEAYTQMNWYEIAFKSNGTSYGNFGIDLKGAKCNRCHKTSIWLKNVMLEPSNSTIQMPNEDMPDDIKDLYNEARDIANKSPKGACALLRLALQIFCDTLVPGSKNINDKIGELVKNGLPPQLQQAFDLVRIVGNNAVHPGEINIDDNPEIALKLFDLMNFIADEMITKPKAFAQFYNNTVPQSSKNAIAKRDNKAKQGVS